MPLTAYGVEGVTSLQLQNSMRDVLRSAVSTDNYWFRMGALLRPRNAKGYSMHVLGAGIDVMEGPWLDELKQLEAVEAFRVARRNMNGKPSASVAYFVQAAGERLLACAAVSGEAAAHLEDAYRGVSPMEERYPARAFAAEVVRTCVQIKDMRDTQCRDIVHAAEAPEPSALLAEADALFDSLLVHGAGREFSVSMS